MFCIQFVRYGVWFNIVHIRWFRVHILSFQLGPKTPKTPKPRKIKIIWLNFDEVKASYRRRWAVSRESLNDPNLCVLCTENCKLNFNVCSWKWAFKYGDSAIGLQSFYCFRASSFRLHQRSVHVYPLSIFLAFLSRLITLK